MNTSFGLQRDIGRGTVEARSVGVQLKGIGQPGDAARNPIRGPGIINFDAIVFRNFHLGNEKRVLIFRW